MAEIETKEILDFVDKMPGFSPAVLKIISLANDPKANPGDIVNAISMDPVLTAKILRLVNSAYFGPGRNIASLNRAVIMLGFNTIKNIALSVSVATALSIRGDFKWFTNDEYWEHCLGCALAARMLAKATGVGPLQVEEFFVAGLLHDIGKAVMIQRYGAECQRIYDPEQAPGRPRHELERESFGISHARLGGLIAQRWKFPESLSTAISFHHAPMEAPEDHRHLALIVHVANYTSHHLKIGIQTPANLDNISEKAREAFDMPADEIIETTTGLSEAVEDAKVFLQKVS